LDYKIQRFLLYALCEMSAGQMINYRFLAMACQPLKLEGQSRTPNMRSFV